MARRTATKSTPARPPKEDAAEGAGVQTNGSRPHAGERDPRNRRGSAVRIAPSLLAADFLRLEESIKPLRDLSLGWLHLDIMDGVFVPNISFGPDIVKQARKVDPALYFDVHLMIQQPRQYVKNFCEAGAQNITFHVEAAGDDTGNLLKYIRRQGCQCGVSIKPKTPVSAINDVLPFCDLVLVMTVEPGFGGQKLIPHTLNKVRELVLLREELGLEYVIQVDGGIDATTAPLAVAAGSDVLVAGTSIFRDGKMRANTRALRKSMTNIP